MAALARLVTPIQGPNPMPIDIGAYRILYRAAKSAARAGEGERRSVLDASETLASAMTSAQH